jgi:hypothetical protein
MVSWWRAEYDASDYVGTNHGTLAGDTTFDLGIVGHGFVFDGNGDAIQLGDAESLRLQNFTIETWIKRSSASSATLDGSGAGMLFAYGYGGYGFGVDNGGSLFLANINVVNSYSVASITNTDWHHVAVTKSGSTVVFYVDGVAYAHPSFGSSFTFSTQAAIGARGDNLAASFFGSMDELAIYNRALSAVEIQAIYNASSAGKCVSPGPPFIFVEPISQTVIVGESPTFSVVADGPQPLSYQWLFNTTNTIDGATNASLTLTNVQLTQGGIYAVQVSNTNGPVVSSNAVLTVNPPPPCVIAPSNLVSWWQCEGNASDSASGNSGTLAGNTTYGAGRVGQGFVFDGNGDAVQLGNPASLQLQNFTVETWLKRSSDSLATLGGAGAGMLFSYGSGGYGFGMDNSGFLFLAKVNVINSGSGARVSDTNWHHVAITKSGTNVFFYIDGIANALPSFSSTFTFSTQVAIAARGDNLTAAFFGLIDELAVYNRALSTNEIQTIYLAGGTGKCGLPPAILTQPQSRTIRAGTNVTIYVVAAGTSPLDYQWWFNATNLLIGATNSSLILSNVQPATNGNYSVVVSNNINSVTSAPAKLSVRYIFVFGNGQLLTNAEYSFINSATIQLQSFFTNGTIFYTVDGSQPSFDSTQYAGSFIVTNSSLLRVITYSADFFQSWEGDPITLSIIPTYSLTATTAGGGNISVNPTNGPYASNSVVNVTATPTNGWTFLGWMGDASSTNTTIGVTMDRNKSVQAFFGTALGTTVAGNGTVTFIPSKFPPGSLYPFGTVVQFVAVPQSGNYFALWGNAASGNTNPLSFAMTKASPTISALFASLNAGEFALTVIPNGFGQVTVSPRANRYTNGQNVTLTAVPDAGRQFIDWSEDATGTNSPLNVLMNQSKIIMANFTGRPSLTVDPEGLDKQGLHLTLTGDSGGHYRIDTSTNLVVWTALVTLTNASGTVQFTDISATNSPLRFYRAVGIP